MQINRVLSTESGDEKLSIAGISDTDKNKSLFEGNDF